MQLKPVSLRASSAWAVLSPSCRCSCQAALCGHHGVGTGRVQERGWRGNGDFFVLLGFSSGGFCKTASWHLCSSEMEQPKRELADSQPGRRARGGSRGAGVCLEHVYRGQEPRMAKLSGRSTGVTAICQDPSLPAPAQDPTRPHRRVHGQPTDYKCESPLLFLTLRSAHNGQHGV